MPTRKPASDKQIALIHKLLQQRDGSGKPDHLGGDDSLLDFFNQEFPNADFGQSSMSEAKRAIDMLMSWPWREAPESEQTGQFTGKPGDKGEWEGEIVSLVTVDSRFGMSLLVKIRTEDDKMLTWFDRNMNQFEVGETVILGGTVKSHRIYRGTRETQLTRGKLVKRVSHKLVRTTDSDGFEMTCLERITSDSHA